MTAQAGGAASFLRVTLRIASLRDSCTQHCEHYGTLGSLHALAIAMTSTGMTSGA